ncbi:MAG TPA: hypothetical protein PLW48_00870 [Alphaproteobacteria bacterium]|nr:hypothetical protein [Rhodospirillaceae bacterium]HRJ65662.1 hypothetical protein [Alphaproteobacteria bacterium]
MGKIKKSIGVFAIFCMLTGLAPLGDHKCAHAAETAAATVEIEITANAQEPPCPMHAQTGKEKQQHAKQDAKTGEDCCGDTCACGMGNCHMAPVLPAQAALYLNISGKAGTTAHHTPLHGVTPELPTPPPKA